MRYAIIHSWPGSRAGKLAGAEQETKTKFFFVTRSMKKLGITFPCLHCFGEDGDAFICSGTFFYG